MIFASIKFETIISILATIISIAAVIYTYKGVKISKYIETITNQRIIWIDKLRSDFAHIITLAVMLRRFSEENSSADTFLETDEYFMLDPWDRDDADQSIADIREKHRIIIKDTYTKDTINKIENSILKLNAVDDKNLIDKLEILKNAFLRREHNSITEKYISQLKKDVKQLLKNEWEMVKLEVRKGGFVNAQNTSSKHKAFWD